MFGRLLSGTTALVLASFLVAGCSSPTTQSKAVAWPTSGPGGCGTKVPASIPPPGDFRGIKAIAKSGITPAQVLHSVPPDTVALWCSPLGAVNRFVHPPSLTVMFLPSASSADVLAAQKYFESTGLFQSVTIEPRYPYASYTRIDS